MARTDAPSTRGEFDGIISIGDVPAENLDYLWRPWIPRGCLSLIAGLPEVGKSTLLAAIVADIAGGPRLEGGTKRKNGNALLFAGEESLATMTSGRLRRAGVKADRAMVFRQKHAGGETEPLSLPGHIDRLRQWIVTHKLALVVFDPLTCYGNMSTNWNDEASARSVLDPLNNLAEETGICILTVRNLNKCSHGGLLERISGSAAFRDVPRSILFALNNPRNPDEKLLLHAKSSAGERGLTLRYTLPFVDGIPRFTLGKESTLLAEDLMDATADAGQREEWNACAEMIRNTIGDGCVEASVVYAKAKSTGIRKEFVWSVSTKMKVVRRRVGFGPGSHVEWHPPLGGWKVYDNGG